GVGLATAGLAMKLSGEHLAFILAAESLVLLSGSRRRHGWLFELLGGLAATWAFGAAWVALGNMPEHMLSIGGIVGAFLIADAWWLKVRRGEWRTMEIHWRALIFSALALLLFARVLPQMVNYPWEPAAFAIAAVVCTASIYLLRLPEVTLLGQLYLAA